MLSAQAETENDSLVRQNHVLKTLKSACGRSNLESSIAIVYPGFQEPQGEKIYLIKPTLRHYDLVFVVSWQRRDRNLVEVLPLGFS